MRYYTPSLRYCNPPLTSIATPLQAQQPLSQVHQPPLPSFKFQVAEDCDHLLSPTLRLTLGTRVLGNLCYLIRLSINRLLAHPAHLEDLCCCANGLQHLVTVLSAIYNTHFIGLKQYKTCAYLTSCRSAAEPAACDCHSRVRSQSDRLAHRGTLTTPYLHPSLQIPVPNPSLTPIIK